MGQKTDKFLRATQSNIDVQHNRTLLPLLCFKLFFCVPEQEAVRSDQLVRAIELLAGSQERLAQAQERLADAQAQQTTVLQQVLQELRDSRQPPQTSSTRNGKKGACVNAKAQDACCLPRTFINWQYYE